MPVDRIQGELQKNDHHKTTRSKAKIVSVTRSVVKIIFLMFLSTRESTKGKTKLIK